MIIVTGTVHARPDTLDRLVEISVQHVHRSRTEPGCLLHSVHHDVEDPYRLVFLEHWAGPDELRAHFRVPESRAFAKELASLASTPPEMAIYDAQVAEI